MVSDPVMQRTGGRHGFAKRIRAPHTRDPPTLMDKYTDKWLHVRTLLSSYLLIWVVDVSLTHVFKLFPC